LNTQARLIDFYLGLGFLSPVSGDEFFRLVEAKHPSLYEYGDFCFILFGPLSLVNHDCESDIGFFKPAKVPTEAQESSTEQTFPLLKRNKNDHADIGEEWDLKFLRLKNLGNRSGWKAGQQIFVRYGAKPEPCYCKSCSKVERDTKRAKRLLKGK
jgi:hypothetical protein